MIKAVIFDYGGVVSTDVGLRGLTRIYCHRHTLDFKGFYQVLSENFKKAKVNQMSATDFWQALANFAKKDPRELKREFTAPNTVNPEGVGLVRLVKKTLKTGLLSNHIEDWLEETLDKENLRDLFDVINTSYRSGKAKPDPKIYLETAEMLEVKPEECVFIDDDNRNVLASIKVGMTGILCEDILTVRAILFERKIIKP